MSQSTNGYQDLIINNGVISTVSNLVTSDNSNLQGIQMNQFAICANPGSTPVLVPYIAPMILSPQTKLSIDGNNQDNRSQNGNESHQIFVNNHQNSGGLQLANNITIPSNMINSGNLPLGLSYINLSQLTSQAGGTAIPIQLALNTGTNQQFMLPLSSIAQLTNDLQLSNAYAITPQIKFEPEIQVTEQQVNQISDLNFPKSAIKVESEAPSTEITTNKRPRKKVIVRKSNEFTKCQKSDDVDPEPKSDSQNGDCSDAMFDHKGRPFMYNCNQCPKKFTQNSRLTAHLRCHSGIRPYTCTQCGFSFTQKSYLIRHAAVHKEDRPFMCSKCLKTYKHYGSLANHRKLHCRELSDDSTHNGNHHNNTNNNNNNDSNETDDLDETIQQTIQSVQMNHQNNNFILTYTANSSSSNNIMSSSSNPIVYFNRNTITTNNSNSLQTSKVNECSLQLSGAGPVVFPNQQELPSMSAVSLLPTNRSAINELKAITTHLAHNVDVDDIPATTTSTSTHNNNDYLQQHLQHIKQEATYFNVTIHQGHGDGKVN